MAAPIPKDDFNLGFIGAGKMAESIARGVVNSGVIRPYRIRTAHLGANSRKTFESLEVSVYDNAKQVVEESDVVVFSVEPQIVNEVVKQLRPQLQKKLLVSVVSGTKLKDLQSNKDHAGTFPNNLSHSGCVASKGNNIPPLLNQEWAGHGRFIRVMSNTPAAVGEASSVIGLGEAVTEEDAELISKLFGAIGKVWTANEKLFDAVTGLSGCGPAYMFLAIEALADGGVAAGLPRELAMDLASQTVLGAATMAIKSDKHPGELKDDIANHAGTTTTGIHELEKSGFRGILMNAVVAAAKRSKDLSWN